MTSPVLVGGLATLVAVALSVLAIVQLARQQHAQARRLALFSMLTAVLFIPMVTVTAAIGTVSSHAEESKATVLARGIADGMNVGGLSLLAGLGALVVWFICVVRMRAEGKRPPPSIASS